MRFPRSLHTHSWVCHGGVAVPRTLAHSRETFCPRYHARVLPTFLCGATLAVNDMRGAHVPVHEILFGTTLAVFFMVPTFLFNATSGVPHDAHVPARRHARNAQDGARVPVRLHSRGVRHGAHVPVQRHLEVYVMMPTFLLGAPLVMLNTVSNDCAVVRHGAHVEFLCGCATRYPR
jgi:hypothetical protein